MSIIFAVWEIVRQLSNGADAPSMFTLENVPEFAMSPSFGFVLLIDINGEHPGGGGAMEVIQPSSQTPRFYVRDQQKNM